MSGKLRSECFTQQNGNEVLTKKMTNLTLTETEIADRLTNIESIMTDRAPTLYQLGQYLSGRVLPTLSPEGFYATVAMALLDFQKGYDGLNRKPITDALQGTYFELYSLVQSSDRWAYENMLWYAEDIARVIFGDDFA